MIGRFALAALCVGWPAHAGAQASRSGGTVEGDVYLVTTNGDVKVGAALEVALIPKRSDVTTRWDAICQVQGEATLRQGKADSVAFDNLQPAEAERFLAARLRDYVANVVPLARQRAVVLRTASIAVSPTGAKGRYAFNNVPAGEYLVFAEMMLRDDLTWWIVPVRIPAHGQVALDLDNNNALQEVPGCTGPPPFG